MYNTLKNKTVFILDNLTKIFKTDFRYLAKGGSLLTLTQISSAIIGFLLTLVYANFLSLENFGIYKYVLATYALIAIAALPGIDSAMIETISKGNHGTFLHAIKTKFKWGFLGTFLSFIYAFYELYSGDQTLFILFILVGIFIPFIESLSIYSSFLNAEKKYGFWTLTEVLNQILSGLILFITIYFSDNVIILVCAYFVTYIIIRLICNLYIYRKYVLNNKIDYSYVNYGITMSWYQIITRGISSIDQMVLFHFMGPAQVAIFSIAQAIPTRWQSVLRISGTLAFPKFANKTETEIAKSLPKKMFIFGLGILLICIIYAIISPIFFKLFFPKYMEAVPYTQLLIFYTLAGMTYPFGSFLVTHKKVKENYSFAIISFCIKAICLFSLIPIYGVWGAAWGVVLSSWSTIIITYLLIFKMSRKKIN